MVNSVLMNIETNTFLYDRIAAINFSDSNTGGFPEQEFNLIREEDLLSVVLPDEPLSFDTANTAELLTLLKSLGKASLPVGRIFEGHINALHLIHLFGTEEQQLFYYNSVKMSRKLSGVWNSQGRDGIKIHDKGDGSYILEGGKIFCSGAGHIDFPLITGELQSAHKRGWQLCIISPEKARSIKADSSFWKPMGMEGSVSYKMDFTGIELTDEDLLGPPDAYYRQPYFGGGAIRFAAVQLGGAEAIFNAIQQFIKACNRTGDSFQRARIAQIACLVETGVLWINAAGKKYDDWADNGQDTQRLVQYAGMVRTVIEDVCLKCMQLAEKSAGSGGFLKPSPIERLHRDLTIYLRQPGPDETLTDIGKYIFNLPDINTLWNDY